MNRVSNFSQRELFRRAIRYLTVEKWYDDNIVEPYQWEFIDGEAEFGESPDKAVVTKYSGADGTYLRK